MLLNADDTKEGEKGRYENTRPKTYSRNEPQSWKASKQDVQKRRWRKNMDN